MIRTKTANRIIYVNDHDNVSMEISPDFASLVAETQVFLISGFNAMQNSELLANRLEKLLRIIQSLPPDATIFYEEACFP